MAVKVLAKRGTAAQIEGAASSVQSAGEIAFATDTKDFYVSDGTQFNKITDLESNGNLSVGNDLFVNGDKLIFTNDSAAAYLQSADTLVLESDYDSDDNPGGKPILFRVSGDTKMVINGRDGNVGIGTTSPTTSLDISGTITVRNSSSLLKRYESTWTTNPTTDVLYNSWTSGTSDYVVLRSQGNQTSQGAFVASRNGAFFGQHGSTGAITDSSTAPLSTTWARIADTSFFNGSVGIGTTTPKTTLEVSGDITIQNNNGSNPTDAGSLYFAEAGLTWGTDFYGFRINQQGSSNYLNFQSANLTTVQDVLTLTRDTARVGIGTTSPSAKLDVVGNIKIGADQNIFSDGSITIGIDYNNNQTNRVFNIVANNSTEVFRVQENGSVGIGTTNPGQKLTVQEGHIRLGQSGVVNWDIKNETSTGKFLITDGLSDKLVITTGNKVGINKTPSYTLDVNGDVNADSGRFNEYLQRPSGIPRANLGDPTVTEMALFESQMSCKTDLSDGYTDLTKVTFWQQPNDGDAWSQVTVSDDNKKKFLRTNNSSIVIPNGTYRYRVEFEPKSYRSAQAFYSYHSYNGNAFAVHVWKRRCSDNQWVQHTDSDVEVGKWPGHLYLPMDAIFWHPTDTTASWRYNLIRIEFIPNWNASYTNDIYLYGGQLWGGYPAGRRTPHTYDHDGNLTLPANLTVPDDLIVSNGNIGIGTTSPATKLEVSGDIRFSNKANSLFFGSSGSDGTWSGAKMTRAGSYLIISDYSGVQLGGYDGSSYGPRLVVKGDGNVGIGTTNPAAELHVETSNQSDILAKSTESSAVFTADGFVNSVFAMKENGTLKSEFFYDSINNQMKIRTSSAESLSLGVNNGQNIFIRGSDGNVGIGTTSPSGALHVNQGTGDAVTSLYTNTYGTVTIARNHSTNPYIQTSFVSGQSALSFYQNSNLYTKISVGDSYFNGGNVGIGTTSPGRKLTVAGTDNLLFLDSSGNSYVTIDRSATDRRSALVFSTAGDGTSNIPNNINWALGTADSDEVGDGTGFFIGTNTAATSAKLFINSSNNVGIGTTSPSEKLHVAGNAIVQNYIYAGDGVQHWGDGGTGMNFPSNDNIDFLTTSSSRVRITSSGNVGIGTTSPATKIDVDGTGRITDTVYLSTNANSKTGIGTTSPTEKLEVSGNIKASGTIKGKMEQMFACSFSDDLGTDKHYLSFTSNAEQTNVHADQAAMVMPYNGRVKSIQMRLSNIDADAIRTFGIETIAPGINMYASSNNWTIEETESYELFAADDFYLINYVFSNENHFEAGDLLAISIQDNEDAYTASRQTYVNVIIEYDLNNGMGNDTSTTKYTS